MNPDCFKILLHLNSVNYRITISSKDTFAFDFKSLPSSISFDELIELVSIKYPSLFQLYLRDLSKCAFEIFDNDFKEYVRIDENSSIDNLSKVRIVFDLNCSLPDSSHNNSNLFHSNYSVDLIKTSSMSPLIDEPNKLLKEKCVTPFFSKCFDSKNVDQAKTDACFDFSLVSPIVDKHCSKDSQKLKNPFLQDSDQNFSVKLPGFGSTSSFNSTNTLRSEAGSKDGEISNCFENFESSLNHSNKATHSYQTSEFSLSESSKITNKKLTKSGDNDSILTNLSQKVYEQKRSNSVQSIAGSFSSSKINKSENEIKTSEEKNKPRLLIKDFGRKILYDTDFYISSLDEKLIMLEVFRKYDERFACLSKHINVWDYNEIWSLISAELAVHNIDVDIKSEFAHLLSQYTDIVTYLLDWTVEDCEKLWPLFPIFHFELTLTPFNPEIDRVIKIFETTSKNKKSQSCLGGLQQEKGLTKNKVQKKKNLSTTNNENNIKELLFSFSVKNLKKKKVIVNALCKHMSRIEKELKDGKGDVKNIFFIISMHINKDNKDIKIKPKDCKNAFLGLLGQYITILKRLQSWKEADCQKLWPFFDAFHSGFNVNFFKSLVKLQIAFSKHPKINNAFEKYKNITKNDIALKTNYKKIVEIKKEGLLTEYREDDQLNPKDERLIQVVFKNAKNLSENSSEEDFWQKIAYEMSSYESPLSESSRLKWKENFYSLLNSYLKEMNNDVIGKCRKNNLFENQDLTTFLSVFKHDEIDDRINNFERFERFNSSEALQKPKKKNSSNSDKVGSKLVSIDSNNHVIPEYLTNQYTFIKIIGNRLNISHKPKKFWKKIYQDIAATGYNLNPNIDLKDYFNSMLDIYLEVMRKSSNLFIAYNTWPFFKALYELDLSPFVTNVEEYHQLKSKFCTSLGKQTGF